MTTLSATTRTTFGLLIKRVSDGFILSQASYDTENIEEVRIIAKEMKGILSQGGEIPLTAQITSKTITVTVDVVEDID